MMARVPSMAFGSPPLTGASRNRTPLAAHAAPAFCATSGLMELMSATIVPGARAFQHAARAEDRLLHFRPVRQHGDDDLRAGGRIAARFAARGAGRHHAVQQFGNDVIGHQRVARLHAGSWTSRCP